jgi:GMP synthase (glutamine-hydrolysing)
MILIVDCGSKKVPDIAKMVDENMDFSIVTLEELEEKHWEECKGIIISGAPILITEEDPEPYLKKVEFLKRIEKPVLGICFGHQLMALTYGGSASRQKEDRDWQTIELINDCPLFDKFPNEFEMMEDHCECVSIPNNFSHIGVSDACINEAMMHKEKSLFGVQFHPEVSGNMGALLIENFCKLCMN